jgi:hypothetical protein
MKTSAVLTLPRKQKAFYAISAQSSYSSQGARGGVNRVS